MKMKRKNLNICRTHIDDLSSVGTVLSEESIRSVAGGGLSLAARSPAPQHVKSDITFEGTTIIGGCGTSVDHDAKECDE